ncbi:MAG TPA: hypothetical protein VGB70_15150 [Allosphingosinicella sp.]|jgi:hypothetical protein
MTTFFAWTAPASVVGAVADHTWVTSYDNRVQIFPDISSVEAAGEHFWYCWGIYRPKGSAPNNPSGYLGSQKGGLSLARCLVSSNLDSMKHPAARGTIFRYGVDGVCHQLSNQVLFATGGVGSPLTVSRARAYMLSVYVYGEYGRGRGNWAKAVAACAPGGGGGGGGGGLFGLQSANGGPDMEHMDEFARRAAEVLADDPRRLAALLQLRGEAQTLFVADPSFRQMTGASDLNARNSALLAEAARIVGAVNFERLFGYPPAGEPLLVDPAIVEAQRREDRGEP